MHYERDAAIRMERDMVMERDIAIEKEMAMREPRVIENPENRRSIEVYDKRASRFEEPSRPAPEDELMSKSDYPHPNRNSALR